MPGVFKERSSSILGRFKVEDRGLFSLGFSPVKPDLNPNGPCMTNAARNANVIKLMKAAGDTAGTAAVGVGRLQ